MRGIILVVRLLPYSGSSESRSWMRGLVRQTTGNDPEMKRVCRVVDKSDGGYFELAYLGIYFY